MEPLAIIGVADKASRLAVHLGDSQMHQAVAERGSVTDFADESVAELRHGAEREQFHVEGRDDVQPLLIRGDYLPHVE
jgi:hypothetical protein